MELQDRMTLFETPRLPWGLSEYWHSLTGDCQRRTGRDLPEAGRNLSAFGRMDNIMKRGRKAMSRNRRDALGRWTPGALLVSSFQATPFGLPSAMAGVFRDSKSTLRL